MLAIGISSCAKTPNNVTLTLSPSQCVTGIKPGYESQNYVVQNTTESGFPQNALMGPNSPYCMAVTMTNNNSGQNANNVQVNNLGLVLSYTAPGGNTTVATSMYDPGAAGVIFSSSNFKQQVANMAVFDPNNCVTIQGRYVNTLNANGGKCTFYMQLLGESLPIGALKTTLSVNYTNGNAQYLVSTPLYQRTNVYAGGDFNNTASGAENIAVFTGESLGVGFQAISSYPSKVGGVNQLVTDAFGNVYSFQNNNLNYMYNGITFINIGPANSAITSAVADSVGNIYVATTGGVFSTSALIIESSAITNKWTQIGSSSWTSSYNPTNLSINATTLSALSTNGSLQQLQQCQTTNCVWTNYSTAALPTNMSSVYFSSSSMFVGGIESIYSISNLFPYTSLAYTDGIMPNSTAISTSINANAYNTANVFATFGINNNESAGLFLLSSNSLIAYPADNYLTGNINGMLFNNGVQLGLISLCAYGKNISSSLETGLNANFVCVLQSGLTPTPVVPILGTEGNGSVFTTTQASMLSTN